MRIEDYLKYDETSKTGLRWIKKPSRKVQVGAEAFTTVKGAPGNDYYGGSFNYQTIYAHRVVMYLLEGKWSNNNLHVHHKDGNRFNNKRSNLEFISASQHKLLHVNKK